MWLVNGGSSNQGQQAAPNRKDRSQSAPAAAQQFEERQNRDRPAYYFQPAPRISHLEIEGCMAAQTAIVQQIAKRHQRLPCLRRQQRRTRKHPIASTKPAWQAPPSRSTRRTPRSHPLPRGTLRTHPARSHTSRHRSRKTRKQSRLTTATIRAAVSRAVTKGRQHASRTPTGKATSIDQPSSDRPSKQAQRHHLLDIMRALRDCRVSVSRWLLRNLKSWPKMSL